MNFQRGSLTCFLIFCHKCDWLGYIGNTIEFNTNHLFDHQIVIPFFCNFPQLLALVCGWKLCLKKYMSPTKIFGCRILKQFVNQITLLCDGKCHCNAAKTILWQLIVTYLLKFIWDKYSILDGRCDGTKIRYSLLRHQGTWTGVT